MKDDLPGKKPNRTSPAVATLMAVAHTRSHKMYQCRSSRIVNVCKGCSRQHPRMTQSGGLPVCCTYVDEDEVSSDSKRECPEMFCRGMSVRLWIKGERKRTGPQHSYEHETKPIACCSSGRQGVIRQFCGRADQSDNAASTHVRPCHAGLYMCCTYPSIRSDRTNDCTMRCLVVPGRPLYSRYAMVPRMAIAPMTVKLCVPPTSVVLFCIFNGYVRDHDAPV